MRLRERARRYARLSPAGRRAFHWSLLVLPVVAGALRGPGLKAAQKFVARMPAPRTHGLDALEVARLVAAAGGLTGASCLPRALALWRLLDSPRAAVRFGVARSHASGFAAHAWVELDGMPLNEPPALLRDYATLESGAQGQASA